MTGTARKPDAEPGTWEELDARELDLLTPNGRKLGTVPGEPCGEEPERLAAPVDHAEATSRRPGWPPRWRREPPAQDLFGLALSGGGIRSATFNLGVLQGLAKKGLLDCFHYLSTVSGGGYIGGFWSAWRAQKDLESGCTGTKNEEKENAGPRDVFPVAGANQPEASEVRHLREFSNFLRPRASLFEIETARMVSALISGIVPCIVITFAAILLLLGGWWLLAWLFTGEVPGTPRPRRPNALPWLPMALYAGVTAAILWIFERRLWKSAEPKSDPPTTDGRERGRFWLWGAPAIVLAFFLAGGVWFLAPSPALLLLGVPITNLPTALGNAIFPALPWLIIALLGLGIRVTFSRCFGHDWTGRMRQAAVDRAMTRLVLAAAIWCGLAVAWVGGQLVAEGGVSGVVGALGTGGTTGGLFAWIRRSLLAQSNEPAGRSTLVRLGFALYQALAYVTLIAIAAGAVALIVVVFTRFGTNGLILLGLAVGLVHVSLLFMDPHEVGLHKFYRARLVRAYLGASNTRAFPRDTAEAEEDDLPLRPARTTGDHDVAQLPVRPLHLICCAANDLAGDPLGSLGRGAESAVASKLGLQVGARFRRWECMESGAPWLSDILTASGAAFNSHMGQISARLGKAVTFLLTALGLRLGLWLENPADPETREEKPSRPAARKRPWGYLFLRELISDSRADASWIHLSDGAHFENLALYELVRRHCRFILLCDCGADPDRAFDDFGNAVRRVREDFGVEIEIDISPLERDPKTGRSRQPMVAGDILYPSADPKKKGDVGVLLYLKPTLTGKEPPDVAQYAERNEQFPHESTIDQFYDEAQWESYRRLGLYAILEALEPVKGYLPQREGEVDDGCAGISPAHVFTRARYYWPPVPKDEPNLDRIEHEWATLEDRLEHPINGKDRRPDGIRRLRDQLSLRGAAAPEPAIGEDDLIQVLPAVREAVRLMEQVFLRTEFGRDDRAASSRLYMGWFNRFGLWAGAPLFQVWWPWLAPYRAGDFTDFMEEIFELRSTVPDGSAPALKAEVKGEEKEKGKTKKKAFVCRRAEGTGGFARSRYDARASSETSREAGADGARADGEELWELYLEMLPTETSLNAGVVRITTKPLGDAPGKIACWTPRDLYVPPGLWAIGVGETFVREMLLTLPDHGFVQVEVEPSGEPSISEDALYTGAGFLRRPQGGYLKVLEPPGR